jgi:hypothetical protein
MGSKQLFHWMKNLSSGALDEEPEPAPELLDEVIGEVRAF